MEMVTVRDVQNSLHQYVKITKLDNLYIKTKEYSVFIHLL